MKNLIIIILFALTTFLSSQEKYDLKNKFAKGEKYLIDFKTDQKIIQTIGNNKLNTQQSQGTVYLYEVMLIDEKGNAHLKYTYREAAISIKSDNPGMNVDYNSKRDGTEKVPPAALGMSALVGQSFTVIINSDSKVVEVKGMDKIIDLMLAKVGTALPQAIQKQMETQFKKSFGNDSMKSMMQMMFDAYPGKPVAVNDSWKSSMKLNTMYTMSVDNVYVFKKVESNTAAIAVTSGIKTVKDGENMEINGMKIIPDLTGTQSGESLIDLKNGQLIKSTVNQKINGAIAIGTMNIPMSIESQVMINSKKQ